MADRIRDTAPATLGAEQIQKQLSMAALLAAEATSFSRGFPQIDKKHEVSHHYKHDYKLSPKSIISHLSIGRICSEDVANKLRGYGIFSIEDLIISGHKKMQREDIVKKTGIQHSLLLNLLHKADLMRISGIGLEYAELLMLAGITSVKELASMTAGNLHAAVEKANARALLAKRVPGVDTCKVWIEAAKQLPAYIDL